MCDLCKLVEKFEETSETDTHLYGFSNYWIVVECKTDHNPILVLLRHSVHLTIRELEDLVDLYNSDWEMSYRSIRVLMRSIQDHAHFHLERV